MAKDFVANLIKHEEEFNFSSLEKFLESKCNTQNNKNVYKYCGFIGKKHNHYRLICAVVQNIRQL